MPQRVQADVGRPDPRRLFGSVIVSLPPTQAGERRIPGVPLQISPSVAAGVVWAYDRDRVRTVLREDVTLAVDASRYFESDRVAIRTTMRIGFAFGHPQSVVKITTA